MVRFLLQEASFTMTMGPYSSATRFRDEDIRVRDEVFQEGAECPAQDNKENNRLATYL